MRRSGAFQYGTLHAANACVVACNPYLHGTAERNKTVQPRVLQGEYFDDDEEYGDDDDGGDDGAIY